MAALTERTVLVTGAFGNVGRYVLRGLEDEPVTVVATDVASDHHRELAQDWVAGAASQVRRAEWVDLTDAGAVARLVADADPDVVLHLAGVIPPAAYRDPTLARAVNVEATAHLVDAVLAQPTPARVVFASSMATFGSRNPHRVGVATAQTPTHPADVYGAQKVEAERLLLERLDDVVVLRLGAVMFPESTLQADPETLYMTAQAPGDGRLHGVDARDCATAFVHAMTAPCAGATLLIGGDQTWRQEQDQLMRGVTAALGLGGMLPANLPGDPDDDGAWFCVDWMDTTEAQRLLDFQHHTWDDFVRDVHAAAGWRRRVLPLVAPLGRVAVGLTAAYRRRGRGHAPMWTAVAARWGAAALAQPAASSPGSPESPESPESSE